MDLVPIFPLPNVVLFPNVFLALHIFEPRYRAMIGDALGGDRLIGMVLLRPGWERDYEGRPPIYSTGCLGVITHAARLDDGRYNIVLRGVQRVRVLDEDHRRPYRRALYETLAERAIDADERAVIAGLRERLELLLASAGERLAARDPQPSGGLRGAWPGAVSGMNDEELVNALAQYLGFDPLEKLALLEQNCLRTRAQALLELIEMKQIVARTPGLSRIDH